MVRRERQQRRNRDRIRRIRGEEAAAAVPVASLVEPNEGRWGRGRLAVQGRMASFHRQFGRGARSQSVSHAPVDAPAVEMRDMNGSAAGPPSPPTTSSPPPTTIAAPPSAPPATTLSPPAENAQPRPPPSPRTATATAERSERARRRISLFMHQEEQQHPTVEEEEQDRTAGLPRWRKAIKSVFPGF
ncbi:MAG: hypothetical protein Q9218_001697 [Villophora microphyllina]